MHACLMVERMAASSRWFKVEEGAEEDGEEEESRREGSE